METPSHTTEDVKLNDAVIRLVGIPFFGISIPNLAGLFGHLNYQHPYYWIGYLYFILLAFLIWQGNRFLLFRTRQRLTWFDRPKEKIILLVVNNVFYTVPLTALMLWGWYTWAGFPATNWKVIQVVSLINVICVLFITHVYETVFLLKEKESELVKNARLQRARAEAELTALKNQVDPHFMFNSLNTLSYLIAADPKKAAQFTENLAEVYRYILSQKDQSLVLLEDELAFTSKYTDLLRLRFGHALIIDTQFNSLLEKNFLIPPTSVFIAFENAVKHNEISEENPLHIAIGIREGCLLITNDIRERHQRQHSSRIGLRNLDERFKIITGRGIFSKLENNKFYVSLPMVALTS
jgi:sensor histidine kinase YesM